MKKNQKKNTPQQNSQKTHTQQTTQPTSPGSLGQNGAKSLILTKQVLDVKGNVYAQLFQLDKVVHELATHLADSGQRCA